MAVRLGQDGELVRAGAWLHDAGMEGMRFVARPGPVTPAERRVLQTHPERGYALLRGSGSALLDAAAEIALGHHERFDGTGYPHCRMGEEIPLVARITAVADAFDALTTDRPYRATQPLEHALETLRDERGQQFDPVVVDAFIDALEDVLAIGEAYPDEAPRLVSPQEAAELLWVSTSRVRRWADEGKLPSRRTSGGHRRFPLDAVMRLAAEAGGPSVRPIDPPAEPLPVLAELLRTRGRELATHAAKAIYAEGPGGWFATASPARDTWLARLEDCARKGRYPRALTATKALMHRAQTNSAGLLERHSFLERFGQVVVRELVARGQQYEARQTRRLIASLQQAMLADT